MNQSPDLAVLYRQSRQRICTLLTQVDTRAPVPACPGWTISDVLAHLVGIVEDVTHGRLAGPPNQQQTAEQVARHRHSSVAEMVEEWSKMALGFEKAVGAANIWPAFLDVLSHEHDIRGAANRPANRQSDEMLVAGRYLIDHLRPTQPLTVRMGDYHVRIGDHEPSLELSVTPFEAFRFRLGRRSARQIAAMDWTGDPSAILSGLTIFGPSDEDIVE